MRLPVHPLWGQIFVADQRTLEVPGDSGLVMWQGIAGKSIGLAEYLNGDYRTNLLPRSVTALRDTAIDMGGRRYTSIVDLEAAKSLSLMAQSAQSKLKVRYARDVRPNDLKQGNVILVGAAEANPWVELFEHNMHFVFFNDRVGKTFSVINREPRGGENGIPITPTHSIASMRWLRFCPISVEPGTRSSLRGRRWPAQKAPGTLSPTIRNYYRS